MAEQGREQLNSLDFGVEATGVAGNLQAAEAFLSGDDKILKTNPNDLEEIDNEEDGEESTPPKGKTKAKPEVKKPEVKKPERQIDPLDEMDEDNEEYDEDQEDEDDNKGKKPVKKVKAKQEAENQEDNEESEEKEEEEDEDGADSKDLNYTALAKDLFKLSVFTPLEGEDVDDVKIKTPDQLRERFQKEGQVQATQWLDSFLTRNGDDKRDLFQAIFIDGVDPKDYFPVYNEFQSFTNADISKEETQEAVYREYNRRLGWDPDKIEKRLQRLKDSGDLETDAKDMYTQILRQDEERMEDMREQKAQQEQEQQRIDLEYRNSIARILEDRAKTRDFDGLPINDKTKNQAFDFLYTKKYKTADGQLLTDFDKFILDTRRPENHALRIKIALLALNNFDFSKIEKRGVTKESSTIFEELAQKRAKKGSTQKPAAKVSSWFQQE